MPGTVLTTLVDRGIYPDPDYGLNNLAIPETLNKQDYWYRVEFDAPASLKGRRVTLTFNGINYAAAAWLNGKELGSIRGAFLRGSFDVTGILAAKGKNTLAVRVSPPPHPGIPHEQSIAAGPGKNGGIMCSDGPTFFCMEGWDWIPGIRDRGTGIWQDVTLSAAGDIHFGDVQVITRVASQTQAAVTLVLPVQNASAKAVNGVVKASFGGVALTRKATLPPGESAVTLAPEEFPALNVKNPRLWWPNGYGKPELYHLKLSLADSAGRESDTKSLRFGIREISYELTLRDNAGKLDRVEFTPAGAIHQPVVDVSHAGIFQTPEGWVHSLVSGAESSAAIHPLTDTQVSPFLVIRVNGVRIAVRGGNWGIDDSRKRVSRERLEPYVRLHRDANLNMLRNWCGQSTEEALYDLAA
ncbi:MAG: beta galactosidase jelly roll domain-containing protein, partial [Acidobacteria bacterium]|nr:beta galactosidase jelly roll domain-containing protein [Acidobacteriota bacterium]